LSPVTDLAGAAPVMVDNTTIAGKAMSAALL
jgi:hypothetical protein